MFSKTKIVDLIIFVLAAFVLVYVGIWVGRSDISEVSTSKAVKTAEVQPPHSNVIQIIDGDTIEMEGGEKVRYLGINTPEIGEPYFNEATEENKRLVEGQEIELEFDVQTKDRFGRLLAYVWVGDVLVNEELVKNGFAVSQTIQPNVKYQDRILEAQKKARENCRGLWSDLCISENEDNCIRIVKINANAPGNDNNNKNGEWIEIENSCDEAILLDGWLLKDTSASNRYNFSDFELKGQGNVTIYSGCGADSENKLYWQCPEGKYAVWNNTGDTAFLYDDSGNLVSEYEY